jgi:probable rRNA maturation factor
MSPRATRRRADRGAAAHAVTVQKATRAARLPRGTDFAGWVRAAGAGAAVTVRLVGWAESRRLNHAWRGKDGPTNVLAFPAGAFPGAGPEPELGDLVVCLPLVHREAREQGKTALQHLAHLVVHGTLHLLGHDHDRAPAARRMEAREARVLGRLGFPDPYRPAVARGAKGRGRTS